MEMQQVWVAIRLTTVDGICKPEDMSVFTDNRAALAQVQAWYIEYDRDETTLCYARPAVVEHEPDLDVKLDDLFDGDDDHVDALKERVDELREQNNKLRVLLAGSQAARDAIELAAYAAPDL